MPLSLSSPLIGYRVVLAIVTLLYTCQLPTLAAGELLL